MPRKRHAGQIIRKLREAEVELGKGQMRCHRAPEAGSALEALIRGCPAYLLPLAFCLLLFAPASPADYARTAIEEEQAPWGKAMADVDGDGFLDLLEGGGNLGGRVYWYRHPEWSKFLIGTTGGGDDLQTADINGDGAVDLVVNRSPIAWYENPRGSGGDPTAEWTRHVIHSGERSHDIRIVEVDRDGALDVVVRSAGGSTRIYFQDGPDTWPVSVLDQALVGAGGLDVADIDRDGRVDVVGTGYWLEQPVNARTGSAWTRFEIGAWPAGGSVDTADLNHDGWVDVSLAASETGPGEMAWFEAPEDPEAGTWTKHSIGAVEDVHRHVLADMDGDGELDIVFAEMHQSPTDRVAIYYNEGDSSAFALQILATTGSHNIAVGDIGGDGDLDILGANWSLASPDRGRLNLWVNDRDFAGTTTLDDWIYIKVDDAKPDRSFGLAFADLDGDERVDIITGRGWYRNPGGDLTGSWTRTELGSGLDAMLALDVDGNGQPDLIAQGAVDSGSVPIVWLKPDDASASSFSATTVATIPADPADGGSQGYALGQLISGGHPEIILSTVGIYSLEVPDDPGSDAWPLEVITSEAREEGVALGDIDRDDDLDVVAMVAPEGTTVAWWENDPGGWIRHDLGTTSGGVEGDRLGLADVDWDGKLDVVLSETTNRASGNALFWFAQPEDPTADGWLRTAVASDQGSLNSMSVFDMNGDGRPDIVTGEHRGALRLSVWENLDGGTTWLQHVVDTGKESHLGARVVDLDGNGTRDVVSIAFDAEEDLHLWRLEAVPEPGARLQAYVVLLVLAALRRCRRGMPLPRLVH